MTKNKLHHIPIYDLRFIVGVFDKHADMNKALVPWFGPKVDISDYIGTCVYSASNFAVVLKRDEICHELIAHEVFHATSRMMQFFGGKAMIEDQEPSAYLCGYITQIVYNDLARWNLKIKPVNTFNLYYKRPLPKDE